MDAAAALGPLIRRMAGDAPPIRIEFWDGSALGPEEAPAGVRFRSVRALQRLLTAPGELGLGRAYVAGEIELEGDLDAVLDLGLDRPDLRVQETHDAVTVTSGLEVTR